MQIDNKILIEYGGYAIKYEKGAVVFHEGDLPNYYYQVLEGTIKVYNSNAEGKTLAQSIFKNGDSFGEPPILLSLPYPNSAIAKAESTIIRIAREGLLDILRDYPEIAQEMLFTFARRIYDKSKSAQIWVCTTPEEKIVQFLKNTPSYNQDTPQLVPYTRKQIAEFTGLRIETVIRTLIKMNKEQKLNIINHKIYY